MQAWIELGLFSIQLCADLPYYGKSVAHLPTLPKKCRSLTNSKGRTKYGSYKFNHILRVFIRSTSKNIVMSSKPYKQTRYQDEISQQINHPKFSQPLHVLAQSTIKGKPANFPTDDCAPNTRTILRCRGFHNQLSLTENKSDDEFIDTQNPCIFPPSLFFLTKDSECTHNFSLRHFIHFKVRSLLENTK